MNNYKSNEKYNINIGGRVLFVIPDNYQDDNVFPMGPGYLAAVLQMAGVTVETYCMDVFHYSLDDLRNYLNNNSYDMVCLGYMGPRFKRGVQDTCIVISQSIEKDCWFVIGGYGPSSCPEYMLKNTMADVLVIGEGEETLLEVMMARKGKGIKLRNIKSVAFMHNNEFVQNERRQTIRYLNELPQPAWDIFPMEKYTNCLKFAGMNEDDRAFPIVSTRGCTDKCSFCFRLDSGIRIRKPEQVIHDMKVLNKHYGVNYFYFVDELAIVSKRQILKLLDQIVTELPPIKFRIDCRVTCFDEDIAIALKQAGCVFLNIGFETSSQKVLDQMNKRATITQNVKAAELALKHGLGMGINIIWGMAGDTLETMKSNAKFIKKYNQYDQIRTMRPVTPYPGSPLFNIAVSEKKLKGPEDFYNKFGNSDLYLVNFTDEPIEAIYETLYEVNKDLILDHYKNTTNDMEMANELIERFRKLYFEGDTEFRGPRNNRLETVEDKRTNFDKLRTDSATTMGVWDGLELVEGTRLSGM